MCTLFNKNNNCIQLSQIKSIPLAACNVSMSNLIPEFPNIRYGQDQPREKYVFFEHFSTPFSSTRDVFPPKFDCVECQKNVNTLKTLKKGYMDFVWSIAILKIRPALSSSNIALKNEAAKAIIAAILSWFHHCNDKKIDFTLVLVRGHAHSE